MSIQKSLSSECREIDVGSLSSMPISDARAILPTLIKQVAENGSRVVLTKHGAPAAALVPVHDLSRLNDLDHQIREEMSIDTENSSELVSFSDEEPDDVDFQLKDLAMHIRGMLENPTVWRYVHEMGEIKTMTPFNSDDNSRSDKSGKEHDRASTAERMAP